MSIFQSSDHHKAGVHGQKATSLSVPPKQTWPRAYESNDTTYLSSSTLELLGPLDIDILEQSFTSIVLRHESLHMALPPHDGLPVLTPVPDAMASLALTSLVNVPAPEREAIAHQELRDELRQPFDLAHGPLVRARLIRLEATRHILMLLAHPIIADNQSVEQVMRALGIEYDTRVQSTHAPQEHGMRDDDQYLVLTDERRIEVSSYWAHHLRDLPPIVTLPGDFMRPAIQSFEGSIYRFTLPQHIIQSLHTLESDTRFATLLASFVVLAHRYTGQSDIVVGTPASDDSPFARQRAVRSRSNVLALRHHIQSTSRLTEVLHHVQAVVQAGREHQEMPFDLLLEQLGIESSPSYAPLFQVFFAVDTASDTAFRAHNIRSQPYPIDTTRSEYDLSMRIRDDGEIVAVEIEYRTDLFTTATIARLAGHYQRILTAFSTDAYQRVQAISITTAQEQEVLAGWNDTTNPDTLDHTLVELIERQAAHTPDARAVIYEHEQLSYQELDTRANQLAHYLQAHGVHTEVRVGICLERSTDLVVALLGVLKAGGTYVPLDPTYPADRLTFMCEDAHIAVLITQTSLAHITATHPSPVIQIDGHWAQIAMMSAQSPSRNLRPEHLAYIIYTSGSTGKPKGVMNSHGPVCNRLLWMQSVYPIQSDDRVVQKTPFSFDVSVWELFWPLISGACLVVARPGGHKDSAYLVKLIAQHQVTTIHFVPSMLQVFLEDPDLQQCTSLRRVICSGEALPVTLQNRFYSTFSIPLYNLYGPTEAAIEVSHWICERETQRSFVPIGRPIANVHLAILDDHFQVQPIGVPGELCIGGAAVARGYLNRPALTAERFCPDPFSKTGARLYRTGDLARWRADGVIEYLGRRDDQVKLRGFRIELGEIEAMVRQHPLVREAAVVLHGDTPEHQQLVAYVVMHLSEDDINDAIATIRTTLGEWLPEHMVPAAFVALDQLPLTPTGKLSRRDLPAPVRERVTTDATFTAPRNEREVAIASYAATLLGLEQIGIDDNFFAYGGHSLLATRLLTWMRETFHVELSIRDFFEGPTVATMAALVEQAMVTGRQHVTIERAIRTEHIPVTFAQERVLFVQQLEPEENLAYNFQARLLFRGKLDTAALEDSLAQLIQRHESLRTTFHETTSGFVQQIHASCPIIMPVVDLQSLPAEACAEEVQRIIQHEIRTAFDVSQLPLLRWVLIRTAPHEHVLLHVEHHLIHDGWSFSTFLRELNELYNGRVNHVPVTLPEMPIQFADFAYWQRQWLQSDEAAEQLAFWKQTLAGMPPLLELPTDYPRPLVNRYRGRQRRALIPPTISDGLMHLRRREGTSLYVIMLSAFVTLMQRYSGQDDICLGAAIANRRWRESEPLIGMILNNLVLRTNVAGNPTFRELIQRTQKVASAGYANQDIPFDKIVEALQPKRALGYNPLFQVSFNFNDGPLPDLLFTDLELELHRIVHNGSAKFDMNVTVIPRSEERVGSGIADGDDSMELVWEYNIDLFAESTIDQMFRQYLSLLEQAIINPECRIADMVLLTEAERTRIITTWNATQTDPLPSLFIQDGITQQAHATPTAVAVRCGDTQMSYHELHERANQLAHYLRHLGVGPEVRIAVALPRTLELPIALLGILKAGGVYVPIDLASPAARTAWVLGDAQVAGIITRESMAPQGVDPTLVICLDTIEAEIAAFPTTPPTQLLTPANLCYLIYTSGSTGTPKGVMITHEGLSNYVHWAANHYPADVGRGVPLHSPLGFDLTVTGLFTPLMTGGFVDLLPDTDPVGALRTVLSAHPHYTFIKLTPAHLELLSNELSDAAYLATADALIVGGEALTMSQISSWRDHAPTIRIFNEYGPTETVVGCCVHEIEPGERTDGPVPIGRPLANTQLYILDEAMNPVPIGVYGELYIGGQGVARGYLHQPGLTAERFVPNPFADGSRVPFGARIYRSGDIARYRADGVIEYAGRRDTQVKVRGYRIELGEIETVLQEHAAVATVVVTVREDTPGDKRLVAYLVGHPGASTTEMPDESSLRGWLSQRLPPYMVPATYVWLEHLPLTANGKIDRTALPVPERTRLDRGVFVPPRTPTESRVAEIWAATLGIPRVGIEDDFFELGGHSLLATRVMAQIRAVFSIALPLRSLFEEPTVAHLAALITTAAPAPTPSPLPDSLPVIVPDQQARYQPFPMTDVQQAYWVGRFGAVELGNVATHSYREYQVQALDVDRFARAWHQVIARHDALRLVFLPDGRQQVLAHVPPYDVKIHDMRGLPLHAAEAHVAAIRAELSHQIMPTESWPLFDIQVSLLDGQQAIVHYSFDALICDAWSRRILLRELTAFYHDPDLSLPALDLTFRDYVLAEAQLKQSASHQRSLDYWRKRLDTLPPAPELPLARNPDDVARPQFSRRTTTLEPEIWQQLKNYAARQRMTPSGVVLAAFAEILAIWSKTPHFTINLTLFNRMPLHPQINEVVGDFTSLTLLEIDYTSGTFGERAMRLQQQLWNDLDHRAVSGVQMLRELARRRGHGLQALMPVIFTSTLALNQSEEHEASPVLLHDERYGITQTPQVWLDHHVIERDGQLVLNWDLVDELFPAGMVDAMFQSYTQLLRQLADDELIWQGQVRHIVLAEQLAHRDVLNATDWPLSDDLLQRGFVQQAQAHPNRTALSTGSRIFSYGELYHLATQIAHWLQQQGVQPHTLVAVTMEKGWEQVPAVLGTLMAGAAYLPIDASLPAERRYYLLEHGQVHCVLTQTHLVDERDWPAHVQLLAVDSLDPQQTAVLSAVATQPDDLAYVIYTSGSTGVPKGVAIDHRGAVNTIYDLNQRFSVTADDRVLALSSLSFDLSVYDIFGTLAAGGTIVVPDYDTARDPSLLAAFIEHENISIWNSVPALMSLLTEYLSARQMKLPASLRLVYFSGDWIPLTLPDQVRQLGNDVQVIGMGGATEASIWSIIYPIDTIDNAWKSIPYGRPMRNQRFYVLTTDLEPCPVWVPGDLYIGGVGLARGYWRDVEKTAASFVQHPRTGERLYRTGDRGQYLPDGNIEFLGREDYQVKSQGYRIELGEIESVLAQHPAVRTAVVMALGQRHQEKRLAAYMVLHHGAHLTHRDVRTFLEAKLPIYMVPSTLIFLDTLPLTSNGKVDRKALMDIPSTPESDTTTPTTQPPGLVPQVMALVRAVVHQEAIDQHAHLLELGANSIDIVRIANQCEQTFGIRPPLRDLYSDPTIAGIATWLERHTQSSANEPHSAAPLEPIALPALDPDEYETFKMQQHGLREDIAAQPSIQLTQYTSSDELETVFGQRVSTRRFSLQPLPGQEFGELLGSLRQIMLNGKPKYWYASAGGLYPVQTYLFIKPGRIAGIAGGAYYYHPVSHRLIRCSDATDLDRNAYEPTHNRPVWDEAAFGIFFFAQLDAIAPIYRDQSMHFCTIEAGLMTQLLDLAAPRNHVGLCHIGGIDQQRLTSLFATSPTHAYLYSLCGGRLESSGRDDHSSTTSDSHVARIIERVQQLMPEEVQALLGTKDPQTGQ